MSNVVVSCGSNVTISGNVTLGSNVISGFAGGVVVAGNPAKRMKEGLK
jgi:hypothetical protein